MVLETIIEEGCNEISSKVEAEEVSEREDGEEGRGDHHHEAKHQDGGGRPRRQQHSEVAVCPLPIVVRGSQATADSPAS